MFSPAKRYTNVRLIRHDETFEVRVSTFFKYDDNVGRRAVTGDPPSDQALQDAKTFARGVEVETT